MKIKKLQKRYCNSCNLHTSQEVKKVSKGKSSSLSWICRQKKRRGKTGNVGKFKKKIVKSNKVGKRPMILSKCNECTKKFTISLTRSRKWTIQN